jgi:hypothetical protein
LAVWRRRLGDEEREELKRGSNHFGEQAARAFLDGVLDVALGSSDRAIRDHEVLYREDPDDREIVAVLADRFRDRVEIRRHLVLTDVRAGRGDEAEVHALAGLADGERAIELYEQVADDPDPLLLWVPSVRLLMAELHVCAGRVDDARREGESAVAAYRHHAGPGRQGHGAGRRTLDLAHALMRYADLLADNAPDAALAARRESVRLARPYMRVDGPLWEGRHDRWARWASTPTLRHFSGSAHDLALALRPPRRDVAGEALIALQDAVEGYAALVGVSPTGLIDPQFGRDLRWLEASVRALRDWLHTLDGARIADAYDRTLQLLTREPEANTDWHTELSALRDRLIRHLDRSDSTAPVTDTSPATRPEADS